MLSSVVIQFNWIIFKESGYAMDRERVICLRSIPFCCYILSIDKRIKDENLIYAILPWRYGRRAEFRDLPSPLNQSFFCKACMSTKFVQFIHFENLIIPILSLHLSVNLTINLSVFWKLYISLAICLSIIFLAYFE